MKFKNDRPTLIHLSDAASTVTMPDQEFEFTPEEAAHHGHIELMRARWITPQDDEARKFVEQLAQKEASATAQRLDAINKSPSFSPAAKAKAKKNADTTAAAAAVLAAQPTGLEVAKEKAAKEIKLAAIGSADGEALLKFGENETDPEVVEAIVARGKALVAQATPDAPAA
jgi:hypothetical protein